MKFKRKATGATLSRALLLFVLLLPGAAAPGQSDSFFYIEESSRDGGGSGTWNGLGMSGDGMWGVFVFEYGNPLPTGSGLLALSVSGVFYAVMKRRRDSKIQRFKI